MLLIVSAVSLLLCCSAGDEPQAPAPVYEAFGLPQRVTVAGYSADIMEPHLSFDEQILFFNNSNHPDSVTNLHWAVRTGPLTFAYQGELAGANTPDLEGVPSVDSAGNLYFISTRVYASELATVHSATFTGSAVDSVALLPGISRKVPGEVQMDLAVSYGGSLGALSDAVFSGGPSPAASDLVLLTRSGGTFARHPTSASLLAAINTPTALEYAGCFSLDENELFFTRFADGQFVTYRSTRSSATEPFDVPQRVAAVEGYSEAPCLSADGRRLYFHKRPDGANYFQLFVTSRN